MFKILDYKYTPIVIILISLSITLVLTFSIDVFYIENIAVPWLPQVFIIGIMYFLKMNYTAISFVATLLLLNLLFVIYLNDPWAWLLYLGILVVIFFLVLLFKRY